jgi:hypothetical protein
MVGRHCGSSGPEIRAQNVPVQKKYLRLYADSAGDSRVEEASIELQSTPYAPPAPDLYLSQPFPAAAAAFLTFPTGWTGTWHVTPRRQLLVVLSGEIEVELSDGSVRQAGPGTVGLLEDTVGGGHITRVVGGGPVETLVVPLA